MPSNKVAPCASNCGLLLIHCTQVGRIPSQYANQYYFIHHAESGAEQALTFDQRPCTVSIAGIVIII